MTGWFAAAIASLFVVEIPYETEPSVCGVWGCYPPLQALAALHLFWCVVIGAVVWGIREWKPLFLRPLGMCLLIGAAATTIAIVGIDLILWYRGVSDVFQHLWPKRVVYIIATSSDVPLLQSLVAGIVCIVLGRRKKIAHPDI